MTVGTDLCQSYESYATAQPDGSCKAYWDKTGKVWTIGWGSTGPDVGSFTHWSRSQADERFERIWSNTRAGVLRASPFLSAPEHYNRLEALTCFAYNCGTGAYQTSTLRRKVNTRDWMGAAAEFPKWKYSGVAVEAGLIRRRSAERALFLLPVATSRVQMPDASRTIALPLQAPDPVPPSSPALANDPASDSAQTFQATLLTQIASLETLSREFFQRSQGN